jgi:hypothetical protein
MLIGSLRQSGANHLRQSIQAPIRRQSMRQSEEAPIIFFHGEMHVTLECSLGSLPKGRPVWLIGSRRQSTGSFGANQAPIDE